MFCLSKRKKRKLLLDKLRGIRTNAFQENNRGILENSLFKMPKTISVTTVNDLCFYKVKIKFQNGYEHKWLHTTAKNNGFCSMERVIKRAIVDSVYMIRTGNYEEGPYAITSGKNYCDIF